MQAYVDSETGAILALNAQIDELRAVLVRYNTTNQELTSEVSGLEQELSEAEQVSQQQEELAKLEDHQTQQCERVEVEINQLLQDKEALLQTQRAARAYVDERVRDMLSAYAKREIELR